MKLVQLFAAVLFLLGTMFITAPAMATQQVKNLIYVTIYAGLPYLYPTPGYFTGGSVVLEAGAVHDGNYTLLGVRSGTINGDAIIGLSNYASADNTLYKNPFGQTDPAYFNELQNLSFAGVSLLTRVETFNFYGKDSLTQNVIKASIAPDGSAGTGLIVGFYPDRIVSVGGVPEPASWALMIVGFGMVGLASRRRRMPSHVAA
jgi:hypothetical protein